MIKADFIANNCYRYIEPNARHKNEANSYIFTFLMIGNVRVMHGASGGLSSPFLNNSTIFHKSQ